MPELSVRGYLVMHPFKLPGGGQFPNRTRWLTGLGLGSILLTGGSLVYFLRAQPSSTSNPASIPAPVATTISALGRIEPAGTVIRVSVSSSQGGSNRVTELRVKAGDLVQAGQIIAVLDSRDRAQAALLEAEQQVRVAQAQLAQVTAGAKPEEIAARRAAVDQLEAQLAGEVRTQQATIARLQAEWQTASTNLQRNQALFSAGAISAATLDARRLEVTTAQEAVNEEKSRAAQTVQTLEAQIREARATLNQTISVRPTDIATAQAEVSRAIASTNQARAELDSAFIRAPEDGQVLRIETRAGETVGDNGIVELANTTQMFVVAEVFESDIGHVRLGQRATATSSMGAFSQILQGTVAEIGLQIAKRDILDTDPTAATDARVVEVRIQLDPASTRRVAGLTNLQVNVAIER